MKKAIWILVFLAGCSNNPEVREWNLAASRENYNLCRLAYKQNRQPMLHVDHIHREDRIEGLPEYWALKSDLMHNKCRVILGEYWVEDYNNGS